MGQYLSSPVVHKHTDNGAWSRKHPATGKDIGLEYGISAHQGWRKHMEDAHLAFLRDDVSVFGVFDGHGGAEVARFVAKHLPEELCTTKEFLEGDYAGSLIAAFHKMDELLPHSIDELETLRQPEEQLRDDNESEEPFDVLRKLLVLQRMVGQQEENGNADRSDAEVLTSNGSGIKPAEPATINAGCTAVVALIAGEQLFVANAGDSRAVLSRDGKALALSSDHKPGAPTERERIVAAGGFLSDWGGICRVNGNLSLSRAIGDLRYKQNEDLHPRDQIITAEPEVSSIALTDEDEFLILACDGIWDVKENQEVVDFVRSGLQSGKAPTEVASELLNACLANDPRETRGIGADNMTCAVLMLKKDKSTK